MSIGDRREDQVDLERVVSDPEYRRSVIERLNGGRSGGDSAMSDTQSPSGVSPPPSRSTVVAAAGGREIAPPPPLDETGEP
jgi:hypothetical protein